MLASKYKDTEYVYIYEKTSLTAHILRFKAINFVIPRPSDTEKIL